MKNVQNTILFLVSIIIFLIGYDLVAMREHTLFGISLPLQGSVESLTGVFTCGIAWGVWSLRKKRK